MILILIMLLVGGCAGTVVQESKANKGAFLYLFNENKQEWDRARAEDVKNASCEQLKVFVVRGQ